MLPFIRRASLLALIAASFALLPAAALAAPVNITPPSISGAPEVGETVTASVGSWDNPPFVGRFWSSCPTATYEAESCEATGNEDESIFGELTLTTAMLGRYVFYVEASSDEDGSTRAPSNAIGPVVDTDHPFGLTWLRAPAWWGPHMGDVDFEIGAERAYIGDLTFTCSKDGGAPIACLPEFSYASDSGPHTVSVTANDGNGKSEVITYNWTASDASMTRFTETPDALEHPDEFFFAWEIVGAFDTVECQLDEGEWYECSDQPGWSDNTYIEVNSGGEHTFSIRGVTGGGPSPTYQDPITSFTWTVDGVRPTVTTNLPDVVTTDPFALELTPSESMRSLECSVDERPFTPCKNGYSIAGLEDGWYTLAVRGQDRAGNLLEDNFGFYVEIGATAAIITSKPPHYTNSGDATIAWVGSSPGATFECRFNSPFWQPCTSPRMITGLPLDSRESNNFEIRATKDGRTQVEPSVAHWHASTRPFELEFEDSPSQLTTNTYALFDVDADEYDIDRLTLSCSLDNAAFIDCSDEQRYESLAVGEHNFRMRATDGAATEEISHDWKIVVGNVPEVAFTETPRSFSSETSESVSFASTDAVGYSMCRLDDEAWTECMGSSNHAVSELSDGPHTLSVQPFDDADEPGTAISTSWTTDTTPPVLALSGVVPDITSLPAVLPIVASEPLTSSRCGFDGLKEDYACDLAKLADFIPNGAHSVIIRGFDRAGNMSDPLTIVFTVNVVDAPPVVPQVPAARKTQIDPPTATKQSRIKLGWYCAKSPCKITANIKVGKKTLQLKSKTVRYSAGSVGYSMTKKVKRWIKANGGKGKKATLTVVITGQDTTSTVVVSL